MHDRRARIYSVVSMIPRGRVASYGQVATLAGVPGQARQVGYALAALDAANELPWHRVINARGEISRRGASGSEQHQRALLEAEGIRFGADGRVSLAQFGWRPG